MRARRVLGVLEEGTHHANVVDLAIICVGRSWDVLVSTFLGEVERKCVVVALVLHVGTEWCVVIDWHLHVIATGFVLYPSEFYKHVS